MEQLLKITTVPVQYELKINNARLEYSRSNHRWKLVALMENLPLKVGL